MIYPNIYIITCQVVLHLVRVLAPLCLHFYHSLSLQPPKHNHPGNLGNGHTCTLLLLAPLFSELCLCSVRSLFPWYSGSALSHSLMQAAPEAGASRGGGGATMLCASRWCCSSQGSTYFRGWVGLLFFGFTLVSLAPARR